MAEDQARPSSNKGKGRQKTELKKMGKDVNLQVTFSKRRAGLFKKASELCILCRAHISIIVFSPGGRPFCFGHPNIETLIDRFLMIDNPSQPPPSTQDDDVDVETLNANRDDQTQQLIELIKKIQDAVEVEIKRAKELRGKRKEIAKSSWWMRPKDQFNLKQLLAMKTHMIELWDIVAEEAKRLKMQEESEAWTPTEGDLNPQNVFHTGLVTAALSNLTMSNLPTNLSILTGHPSGTTNQTLMPYTVTNPTMDTYNDPTFTNPNILPTDNTTFIDPKVMPYIDPIMMGSSSSDPNMAFFNQQMMSVVNPPMMYNAPINPNMMFATLGTWNMNMENPEFQTLDSSNTMPATVFGNPNMVIKNPEFQTFDSSNTMPATVFEIPSNDPNPMLVPNPDPNNELINLGTVMNVPNDPTAIIDAPNMVSNVSNNPVVMAENKDWDPDDFNQLEEIFSTNNPNIMHPTGNDPGNRGQGFNG